MRMVDKTVNQRRGQSVVAKDRVPLGELQIGCNNQALALVAVRDHLKQQLGSILVQRHEANLIKHNQLHLFQCPQEIVQRTTAVLFQQNISEGSGGKEPYPPSFLAGFQSKGSCQMCLAGANGAHKNEIFFRCEELQIFHVLPRQTNRKLKIRFPLKVIQRFQHLESGCLHHAVNAVGFSLSHLHHQKVGHILFGAHVLHGAPFFCQTTEFQSPHHLLNLFIHEPHLPPSNHRRPRGWGCSSAQGHWKSSSSVQAGILFWQSCNSTAAYCRHRCGHSFQQAPKHRRRGQRCHHEQSHSEAATHSFGLCRGSAPSAAATAAASGGKTEYAQWLPASCTG